MKREQRTFVKTFNGASSTKVAVLIPCFNEAHTVDLVVKAFAEAVPSADIFVYDNNSTDETAALALEAGALVRREPRQGKGNVIRRMFADIDADVYILVDGDDTYDASIASNLVDQLLSEDLDMINVARQPIEKGCYRPGHEFGNFALSGLVKLFFGRQFEDMLTGYKVFSRRFVKSFPAMSRGFEVETELVTHTLELRMPSAEIWAPYKERPVGSLSKLRTFRDGIRIVRLIVKLVKDERPLLFFGTLGLLASILGVLLGMPLVFDYFQTGLVTRLPTGVLSVGLITIGVLGFLAGMILDLITRTRQEIKRLAYLSIPARHDDF